MNVHSIVNLQKKKNKMNKISKRQEKREALLNVTITLVNNNGFHAAPMSKLRKWQKFPLELYIFISKTNKI